MSIRINKLGMFSRSVKNQRAKEIQFVRMQFLFQITIIYIQWDKTVPSRHQPAPPCPCAAPAGQGRAGTASPPRKEEMGSCSCTGCWWTRSHYRGRGRGHGVDQSQEWFDDALVDDKVSHDRTVSSNVTKGQYSLLADILVRASDQLYEVRNSSTVHNSLGLVRGARGNDGQGQHSLLADILVRASEQLHEMRDSSTVHNSLGLVRGARGNDGQGPPRQPEYGDANSNDLVQT